MIITPERKRILALLASPGWITYPRSARQIRIALDTTGVPTHLGLLVHAGYVEQAGNDRAGDRTWVITDAGLNALNDTTTGART